MWNCYSRRWLVSNEDSLGNHHSPTTPRRRRTAITIENQTNTITTPSKRTTTIEHQLCPSLHFYSKKKEKSHNKEARKKATEETKTKTEIDHATIRSRSVEKGAPPSRVRPCPNQIIIVVILNVLLANCLISHVANMPAAGAAFGADRRLHTDDEIGIAAAYGGIDLPGNYRRNLHHAAPIELDDASGFQSGFGDQMSANQLQLQRSQNFKISPKPCSIGRIEGTCMFVWECIKSEGRHVGMCVDSFMFGSCCSHNISDNIVMSQTFSYTRPTKPVGMSSVNHRPRPPPHFPQRPSISGMTTIERPHGAGTLVIRPSGPHHQGALFRPQSTKTKPTTTTTTSTTAVITTTTKGTTTTTAGTTTTKGTTTTTAGTTTTKGTTTTTATTAGTSTTTTTTTTTRKPTSTTHATTTTTKNPSLTAITAADMQPAASIPSSNMWHTSQHTTASHHWQMSTEPNFVTKPRPPTWEKPTSLRPKPSKPTKKPIVYEHHQHQHQHPPQSQSHPHPGQQQPPPLTAAPTTRKPTTQFTTKPKPQIFTTRPMNTPTTTRPYFRPTSAWSSTTTTTTTTSVVNSTTSPLSSSLATTTQRYTSSRPTVTTHHHTTAQHLTTSTRPPAPPSVTPQQQQQHHHHKPSQPTTTTTMRIPAISTAPQTPATLNLNTVETNEIVESDTKLSTIKTITAARSECGIPVLARPETRIVGGKSAAFGRWPWQVSVRRTSFFGFSSTHRCGGALINENWIATAGHCVDDLLISQIRIRVGEYDFSHVQEQLPYIERGVVKKVVHPKYNFFTYEYDLALVKLEQPLEFAPHVSPICLPQTDSLMIGMNATVTGWGRLSEGGTLPSVLQEVTVPIVSNDNCKTMFLRAGRQEFIPDIFLCAGYETGGQDSCQGDSGGPLQVKSQDGRFFLAGIISWGIGCAEANLPGVCTRISKFVPWIMENVT